MKVQLADREIWIEFAYRMTASPLRESEKVEVTSCLLRDGSAPRARNEEAPLLVRGEVIRYSKDPPNREVARKAALAKALEIFDQVMPLEGLPSSSSILLDQAAKQRRKLFWEAYLNRKPAKSFEARLARLEEISQARIQELEQALRGLADMPGRHCCELDEYGQVIEQHACTCWRSVARAALGEASSMQSRVLSAPSNPAA